MGTSSVRALLFDCRAQLIPGCAHHIPHAPHTTRDGGVEFDARVLLARCGAAVDAIHAQALSLHVPIDLVAMTTFAANLIGLDERGAALTPVITYADTRSIAAAADLRETLDEARTYQRVGAPLHPAYWPAQLAWLRVSQPDSFHAVSHWRSFGEYCLWQWLGEHRCSYSMASWMGLLDRFTLQWDAELLASVGVRVDQLPALVEPVTTLGPLAPPLAARWPLLEGARWYAAVADGAAANVGSGCFDRSRAALTVGTTAALRVVMDETPREVPRGLWCYRLDARRALVGGALSEGGNIVQWLRDVRGEAAPAEDALASLAPDSHGLTLLPLIAGERSPGWHADARAAIVGLHPGTTPEHMIRAAMEAVALRLARVWQLLRPLAPQASGIVAAGGALVVSPLWVQIIADALDAPVSVTAAPEATARGAALLALEALGVLTLAGAAYAVAEPHVPDPASHRAYTLALARQQALYDQLV